MEEVPGEIEGTEPERRWSFRTVLRCMLAGLGMFAESYFIFTTGQMHGIWRAAYPECWASDESDPVCLSNSDCPQIFGDGGQEVPDSAECQRVRCNESTKLFLSGSEFIGIMAGMLFFAYFSDIVGRRVGSVVVSFFMLVGSAVMTFTPFSGGSKSGIFTAFTIGFAILGFGIGGEYPLSSVSATERAEEFLSASKRGSYVVTVFTMQGLGALVGSSVLLVSVKLAKVNVLDCSNSKANALGYNTAVLGRVWRSVYIVGFWFLLLVILYRLFFTDESAAFSRRGAIAKSSLFAKFRDLHRFYFSRLFGTALSWFLWDVCFYGNKLFISSIISSLRTSDSLVGEERYILINNLVSLAGYILAILLVDRIGRRNMQAFGFTVLALVFLLVTLFFDYLESNSTVIMSFYLVTSFFGQLGPNATTYLLPAETFPTEVRSIAHGISAFSGKVLQAHQERSPCTRKSTFA
mmetsp:Transcript_27523/g.107797  ORF Transcript_27523/g.107797 Transcript_27523/m.107797 type:complete len:464 (+) Transcript_27523:47-1438(+)